MSLLQQVERNLLEGAVSIARRLRSRNHEAYFAGGVVRDLLLGRAISDIDIATSARPADIEHLFDHTIPVGRQFGVILVVFDDVSYEVATFRRESDYQDGRHPTRVSFASAQEDAQRRDFTVNGLLLDPESEEVIDFVQGRRDLNAALIRTIGRPGDRFSEDKLRLMRAVRLACQLDFQIEAETLAEIQARAADVLRVSWERIRDELLKLLTGPAPDRGLSLMLETGLLSAILPEVTAMFGVEQPAEFHPEGDVFTHTRLMFTHSTRSAATPARSEELAMGILLHDIGKPPTFKRAERIRFDGHAEVGAEMAYRICKRLRLSSDTTSQVVDLVKDHLRFMNVQDMKESTLKRFLRKSNFSDHLELHRLDCLASHRNLSNYDFCLQKLAEYGEETIRPDPLLNGKDLIRAGLKPGPLFSQILTELEDHQLEGRIQTREQAVAWLEKHWLSRS